jgi:hypothetical protein
MSCPNLNATLKKNQHLRFRIVVSTAVLLEIRVFWDMTPCFWVRLDLHWVRALKVPMHQGLMALCAPSSDISSGESCPFTKVPDGPQI